VPADPAPPTLQDMLAWVEDVLRSERENAEVMAECSDAAEWPLRVARAEAVAALLRREMARQGPWCAECGAMIVGKLSAYYFGSGRYECLPCVERTRGADWLAGTGKARPAGGEQP
jgi:hypothetical protein